MTTSPDSSASIFHPLKEDGGSDRLLRFLEQSRNIVESYPTSWMDHATLVMGNEACDLDSMVSAIMYAFHLTLENETPPSTHGSSSTLADDVRSVSSRSIVVPIMNTIRRDFRLRTEAVWLFGQTRITPDLLIFIDEVDLYSASPERGTQLVLVDHNQLGPAQRFLTPIVSEIVDHHDVDGPIVTPKATIEPVGSCCTLVARSLLHASHSSVLRQDPTLAWMLASTILLDTSKLNPRKGRCSSLDEETVDLLLSVSPRSLKIDKIYSEVHEAKKALGSLTCEELLRKDYKQYEARQVPYGISSVGIPLNDLVARAGSVPELQTKLCQFRTQRRLEVYIVMFAFRGDVHFERQLLVLGEDSAVYGPLARYLQSETELALEGFSLFPGVFTAQVGNISASRKVVQPLVQRFLDKVTG